MRAGIVLKRKDVQALERQYKRLIGRLYKLENSFLATDGDTMITVFRPTKRQRRIKTLCK